MKFNEWLTQKYVDWRGNAIGRDRSVKEFSDWIGVSNQLMSDWMKPNGKIPKHKETIDKLVTKFGLEIYDILNIPNPLRIIPELQATYDIIPHSDRAEFEDDFDRWLSEWLTEHGFKRIK